MRLIDKDALVDRIAELAEINREWKPEYADFCDDMACIVEDTPYWEESDLKTEPKHGRWERVIPSKSAEKWSTMVSCSNCHARGYTRYNFCHNCGADMREVDDG